MKNKSWLSEEPSKEYKNKVMEMAALELEKNKALQPNQGFFRRFFVVQLGVLGLVGFGLWRALFRDLNKNEDPLPREIVNTVQQIEMFQLFESSVESEGDLELFDDMEILADLEVLLEDEENWELES